MKVFARSLCASVLLMGMPALAQDASPSSAAPPQLSRKPSAIKGPAPKMPAEARLAGHHGLVVLKGILNTDGKLRDVSVGRSSNSPFLDAAALVEIKDWTFSPALGLDGNPVEIPISVPLEFSSVKAPDGGLRSYRCKQFILDGDWYAATFGAEAYKKEDFYLLMAGMDVAARYRAGKLNGPDRFDARWAATIEECRKRPDELFFTVFGKTS